MRRASMLRRVLAWFGSEREQLSLAHDAWIHTRWAEAERWAERAARGGSSAARMLLFNIYMDRNVAGDRRRAFESCEIAAGQGNVDGMHTLAWCFQQGVGVAPDRRAAVRWYRAAADAGFADSQIEIARFLLEGHAAQQDLDIARHYAELAQAAGAPEAEELLKQIATRRA